MLALLVPLKGVDLFLRAAAELAPDHPDWRFTVFGEGEERGRLVAQRDELGLGPAVTLPGFVRSAQALARLRVLVIASYAENAPMALLEAMGAGVAVVTTAVGGIPEIADESVAKLVPPGDAGAIAAAIAAVLDDDAARAEQVRAARRRVEERYTAAANAEAMVKVYERALGSGGGA
jgi:glycosyltransferase involved in cell wall biosynthesis